MNFVVLDLNGELRFVRACLRGKFALKKECQTPQHLAGGRITIKNFAFSPRARVRRAPPCIAKKRSALRKKPRKLRLRRYEVKSLTLWVSRLKIFREGMLRLRSSWFKS